MPRATRHYRLRVRNALDTADVLVLTSVSGGTNPYLTGPPQGDGQEIDPATGESSIGAYTIEAADVGEVITAALVDGSGRQALLQRRAYIELSIDGGSTWPTVLIPGFINSYRLVTPMRWAFTVGESRRIEYTRKVWGQITDAFDQATCLIGGPIKDGWGPIIDYGGAIFRVKAVDADTVTLVPHSGYFPTDENNSQYQYVATDDDQLLPAYTRDRANQLAAAERALTATAADADRYAGITVLMQQLDGTAIDSFTPLVQQTPWGGVLLTTIDELKVVREDTAWADIPPDVDTLLRLYIWRTTIDEHTPLHIDAHPIDILTDLWDEAGIAYDTTTAAATRTLIGANTRLRLRITKAWILSDVEQMIGGLFGINTRVGTDGELELVTTRIRGIAAPANLYDDDDLRSPDTVIFEVDEQSIYNTVTVEQLRFRQWQPGMSDRGADEIVALSRIRSVDLASEGGATPDSATFGVRELRFTVPGEVMIDVSGSGIGDDYFERALATEIFDRYGRGGVYATLAALPIITEKVGDELRLDVSHLPNAGVRGGQRILQVIRRTETPSGPQLLLLDSGPNSQFGTTPTFSVAAGAADARKYVDVEITNAAALNTAGACLRVEWAEAGSEPSGGTLLTQYMVGQIPAGFTTPAVDAGSHVWIRMQAFIPDKRPTAYTAWDDVDLTDLTAPSSLSDSAGSDPALITISFTPGESDIPLEVFQRPQGDPAGEARLVDTLAPGSDRVTLTLVPSDSYTIGLRYREQAPFGGVSSTAETSFTVAGSPITLATPTYPSAVGIKWATFLFGPTGAPYAVGLQVYSAIDAGFVEFELATETAVGSGTPGSYSLKETRSVAAIGDSCLYLETVPLDGKLRYLRARHTRVGADPSAYTDVVSVMPGKILAPALPVDPLDITGIVPVTLGGTGVADPTSGVLMIGAGASPITELAPGAVGGYARSNGSTWARSGLLATDLTGTVASARLTGVYSGITGLGVQAQVLNMGGFGITNAGAVSCGALTATTGTFSGDVWVDESGVATLNIRSDTDNAILNITSGNDGGAESSGIYLRGGSGTGYWSLTKADDHHLRIYDYIGAQNVFTIQSNSNMILSPKGGTTRIIGDLSVTGTPNVEGVMLEFDYSAGDTASRVFFKEITTGVLGFSAIYAGHANPTLGGTAFTLDANTFYFIRHDNSATGAVVFSIARTSSAVTFAADITINALGTFDSTAAPSLDDVLRYNGTKWVPAQIQVRFTDGDVAAEAFSDDTAASYVHDGRTPSGTPVAPTAAPVLTAGYKSIVIDMSGYGTLGATNVFEVSWSTDSGSTWSDTGGDSIVTTGDEVIHTKLEIDGTTYRYRYRTVGGGTPPWSTWSAETSDVEPLSIPDITPATIILASQISTVDLASLSANIGIITAGQLRDSTNTYGVNLGGVSGGIPGTWNAGINFENTAVDGMDRYINFYEGVADGLDSFIKHELFDLKHDGTAIFSGQVDITNAAISQTLQDFHILLRDDDMVGLFTDFLEANITGAIGFRHSTDGGLNIIGISEAGYPLLLQAWGNTAANVAISLESWTDDGAGNREAPTGDADILTVSAGALTRMSLTAAGDLSLYGGVDIGGEVAATGEQVYTGTGTQNNLALDDGISVFRCHGASGLTVTGFAGGYEGRIIFLVVSTSPQVVLSNGSGSSAAENRIYTGTGADLTLTGSGLGGCLLIYANTYWHVIGTNV